ncbi:MAG: transporter substrate-binding domain-containing protein [Psychroflexus halocasei]
MSKIYTLLFILLSYFSFAQEDSLQNAVNQTLKIGVTHTPPFIDETGSELQGLSVKSWELVNDELNWKYEYKSYENLGEMLDAVEKGEVDFSINPVTVTDNRMERLDFSQPYFISNTAIAKQSESVVWSVLKNLWSWKFISALLGLLAVIFIFGFLVWIFERRKNPEEFGGEKGLFDGFWWSAVTMTTVGYGDKSPQSLGGRIIGLIWMFMAVIILSSLTAGIASALTVQSINDDISSINDLSRFSVATVENSSSQELLDLYGIKYQIVENGEEGIKKLADEDFQLFIYDKPILQYEVKKQDLSDDLMVLENSLKKDYFSYSFPKGSQLIEKINPELISVLKSMEWNRLTESL